MNSSAGCDWTSPPAPLLAGEGSLCVSNAGTLMWWRTSYKTHRIEMEARGFISYEIAVVFTECRIII